MNARRLSALLVVAVATSVLHPIALAPTPAAAHSPYTSTPDTSGADQTVTVGAVQFRVRVLRPDTPAPLTGWPLIIYMAGDFENRCANVNERGNQVSWYTRKQMAEHGFAVLSFNARGLPANYLAGDNPSGTLGCDAHDDAADSINDSGWDMGGPNDKTDLKGLIDWAATTYSPSGCAATNGVCINGDQVGLFGYGAIDALKTLLMGVPASANPQYSPRVKALVPIGFEEPVVRNLKALSSDGAATPAFRPVDLGHGAYYGDTNSGYFGTSDPSVLAQHAELLRDSYLNASVPGPTTTWFDERTVVDDNATVDKAQEITTPTFMVNSFLDADAGFQTATLAYNKLGATNKHLYVGACGTTYTQRPETEASPCGSVNGTNLRTRVHAFLDRWVRQETSVTVGGPIFYAMPPATNPLTTDNWTEQTDADGVWPPPSTTETSCLGNLGGWWPCGTEPKGTRTMSNLVGIPAKDFCGLAGSTYTDNVESLWYTGSVLGATKKMLDMELDFWLLSDTSRSQVFVDVFDVNAAGAETRVWQGAAQIVPTARNTAAFTGVHYKFKPGGNGWTFASTSRIRIKLAANYKKSFAQELIPATYWVWHDNDNNGAGVKVTMRWAT